MHRLNTQQTIKPEWKFTFNTNVEYIFCAGVTLGMNTWWKVLVKIMWRSIKLIMEFFFQWNDCQHTFILCTWTVSLQWAYKHGVLCSCLIWNKLSGAARKYVWRVCIIALCIKFYHFYNFLFLFSDEPVGLARINPIIEQFLFPAVNASHVEHIWIIIELKYFINHSNFDWLNTFNSVRDDLISRI